jgi:hypothetical protein
MLLRRFARPVDVVMATVCGQFSRERKVIYVAEATKPQFLRRLQPICALVTADLPRSNRSASTCGRPSSEASQTTSPNAQITFDKFHVIAHTSEALVETRQQEQKLDPNWRG